MDPPPKEGPDGSSIRPVSSLLARFESMNHIAPPSPQSTSRPISPAPRPDRPSISAQSTGTPSPFPSIATKPSTLKPKPPIKPKPLSMQQQNPPPIPQATKPGLLDNPAAQIKPAPAVTILPPQSPPKTSVSTVAGDQSPFLDASAIPDEHPARSPSPLSVGSRPLTPTPIGLGISRTSRNASPKPPSPPPPRRSGELRRDRDFKLTPVLSATKPVLPPPNHNQSDDKRSHIISSEISPFTSPPSSPESDQEEAPPQLPSRPKPSQSDAAVKYRPQSDIFAPPPRHHATLARQREEAQLGRTAKPQDIRPVLPARRQTHDVITPVASSIKTTAPPRPPRAIANHIEHSASVNSGHNSPISSSVPSAAQFLPPPTRALVRAKTSDLSAGETTVEVYSAPDTKSNTSSTTVPLADISNTNRRSPYIKKGCYEIPTKYEPRKLDVCGDFVCTTGHYTRGWSMMDGEQITSQAHTEGVKATAIIFKPSADPSSEGSKVWVGTNAGDLMELDVLANRITAIRSGVHGRSEILRIHRYYNELWSLDEAGNLLIWGPQDDGMPDLNQEPAQSYKVPRGHTFSIVVDGELWHVAGRTIRIFEPSLDGSGTFQVLIKPMAVEGAGDVNAGALIPTDTSRVYLGHNDGKVSVYSTESHTCEKIIHVSGWRINSMTAVGNDIWIGHNTGKICIYGTSTPIWSLKKEWQAHENTVHQVKYDPASSFLLDRLQVVSVGGDGKIKVWDALLQDDRIEQDLKDNEQVYCTYDNLKALIMTWNAGASTPHSLRYSEGDGAFFRDLLQSSGSPDILVFGFQELVDLEDKTATAKRLLKSKKKDDSERMSHQYRDWRDFLLKSLDDYMPRTDLYHLLHTAPLVGLFTCVFVKSSLQGRIRNVHGAEVKRGMGGLHGNKGALAVRFQVDDSSLCFVNCHLAAGQSQTSSRHADVAAILEANLFPTERDPDQRMDTFVCGGDGGMIVDHETCILNGDLNYRIDTMSRDTVVKAVKAGNINKLLDRDQLLAARRKNPGFRLRAFQELPIQFNPTYKYDVGTDNYDTSEKRRSPAWCDRLLFRGHGTVEQLDYRRHEVRVSDHRPVTGSFKLRTKKVNNNERAKLRMECQQRLEQHLQATLAAGRLHYLENVCGFDEPSSKTMIKERLAGKR